MSFVSVDKTIILRKILHISRNVEAIENNIRPINYSRKFSSKPIFERLIPLEYILRLIFPFYNHVFVGL